MRGQRRDQLFNRAIESACAGTALGLILAALSTAALAGANDKSDGNRGGVEVLVPVPQPADVKPPTIADVTAPTTNVSAVSPNPVNSQEPSKTPAKAEVKESSATPDVTGATPSVNSPSPVLPTATTSPAGNDATPTPPISSAPAPEQPEIKTSTPDAAPSSKPAEMPSTTPAVAPKPAEAPSIAPIPASASPSTDTPASPKDSPKDANGGKPLASNLAAADIPIAEKLRDAIPARLSRLVERRNERTGVETFYTARGFAPLWIESGVLSERGKAVIARLKAADTDGLDPGDYPTPDFAAAADHPDLLADNDVKLTNAVLTYARHAQLGRVHYSRISADIFYNQVAPEPADILTNLAGAKDVAQALGSYNPPHEGFRALRAKLAEARGTGNSAPARIANGATLKLGMHDERVPLLRSRLDVPGDGADTTYDKVVAEAVKKFQRDHDLSATGNLNSATIEALNGPRRDHDADIIIANMERWRWMPRDLGKSYVIVNIPDYTLKVMHDGAVAWHTRIVTGKPSMPTPLLSEPMRYITVNPTWNVPPSIIQNEYLPALQQDPDALARIGLRVDYNRDGTVHIWQPPGDGNALGHLRFNFPNKFLVYQHDTPDKYLFAHDKRAYSHGCMRVQDPAKYAEVLLSIASPKEGYTTERIQRMFGHDERDLQFATPIPVHITYQTAFVDDAGKLQIREDVYGRDARVLAALKGEDRRIADIPVEHHDSTRHQAVKLQPGQTIPGQYGYGFRDNGPSFFERLFGSSQPAQPPRPPAATTAQRSGYYRR